MSHYDQHPAFYNEPVLLTDDDKRDPLGFFEQFFEDRRLSDLRKWMEEMKDICLTTDQPPFDDPKKRADTILLHKNAMMLFEAAFMIYKSRKIIEKVRKIA